MSRKLFVLMLAACFALSTSYVYGEGHGMMMGKMKGGDKSCHRDGNFEDEFCDKAMMILKSQEELGLSDEQVKKIKDLKMLVKKDLIRKKADIDILAIDIKSAMREDVIDVNAVNALIDKKYEIKKEKAKSLVAALAVLKTLLTEEQRKKLKTLCGKEKGKKKKD